MENWVPINNHEGKYEVSSFGRVRSIDRYVETKGGWTQFKPGVMLKPVKNSNGYLYVCLSWNENFERKYVHQLVLENLGSPKPEGDYQVAHNDGNRVNNVLTNLRWATPKENNADKEIHGTTGKGKFNPLCSRGHKKDGSNLLEYGKKKVKNCRACILMLNFCKNKNFSEDKKNKIADDYYELIISGEKFFYQPYCHKGHRIFGKNCGLYKSKGKKYCKSCDSARRYGRKYNFSKDEIKEYADSLYVNKFGGGYID